MSSSARNSPESGMPAERMEERLLRIAAALPYPETPDLAAREKRRLIHANRFAPSPKRSRLTIALVVLFIGLLAVFLVSPVRARVLDWIRIGSVRIFFTQPTLPATVPLPSGTPSPVRTLTPTITPTYLDSFLNLSGETTLAAAQTKAGFSIQMPTSPSDLGAPDHVYLQELSGPVVVLVWMDQNQPGKVRMSLSESSSESIIFEKYDPKSVQDTQVNGNPAVWIDGEYLLVMHNGEATLARFISEGHTLIWTAGKNTFRLETDVDLDTAIQMAQSIH